MTNSMLTSADHDPDSLNSGVHFVNAHLSHANVLHEHVHLLPESEEHGCGENRSQQSQYQLGNIKLTKALQRWVLSGNQI